MTVAAIIDELSDLHRREAELLERLRRMAVPVQIDAGPKVDWKTVGQAAFEMEVDERTIWRWAIRYGANFDPGDGTKASRRMVNMDIIRRRRPLRKDVSAGFAERNAGFAE